MLFSRTVHPRLTVTAQGMRGNVVEFPNYLLRKRPSKHVVPIGARVVRRGMMPGAVGHRFDQHRNVLRSELTRLLHHEVDRERVIAVYSKTQKLANCMRACYAPNRMESISGSFASDAVTRILLRRWRTDGVAVVSAEEYDGAFLNRLL